MKPEEKEAAKAIREVTGLGITSAQAVIAVIGTDMSRFPTDNHISSWAQQGTQNQRLPEEVKSIRLGNAWSHGDTASLIINF